MLKGEISMEKEVDDVKRFYEETITDEIKKCNDIEMLDLILKLLQMSNAM